MAVQELEASLEQMKGELGKISEITGIIDGTVQSFGKAAEALGKASQSISTVAASMPRLDDRVSEMASLCRNLDSTVQGVRQDLQSAQRTLDAIERKTDSTNKAVTSVAHDIGELRKVSDRHTEQLSANFKGILIFGIIICSLIIIMLLRSLH